MATVRTPRAEAWRAERHGLGLVFGLVLALTGCSPDGLLNSDKLPPDVADPAITQTPEGALAAYRGTVALFGAAFGASVPGSPSVNGSVVVTSGLLSDELQGVGSSEEDLRLLPDPDDRAFGANLTYSRLQKVRGQASQAIGLLTRYRPNEPALAGRVYAFQGYAELFLAELFCSGVPLSTIDFDGDYTYQAGSSTEQVLAHARALFDTALALGSDSAKVLNLAHVGLGRALLGSGRYAEAAAAVAPVPDSYRDTLTYPATIDTAGNLPNFAFANGFWSVGVADHEGVNGLDYVSSTDPRTPVSALGTVTGIGTQWYPSRYRTDGTSPLMWASGVEARLIEAETALHANPNDGTWLTTLNALRTDGTFETPDPTGPSGNTDTLWHAGTGGTAKLRPLTDPGTDSARVALIFRERAFWLFLTGHRQGDLRRLLRQYPQYWPSQDHVYPVGIYIRNNVATQYGGDVTLPIPKTERDLNPRFAGCLSRQP